MTRDIQNNGKKRTSLTVKGPKLMLGKKEVTIHSPEVRFGFKKINNFTHNLKRTLSMHGYTGTLDCKSPLVLRLESEKPEEMPFVPYKLLNNLRTKAVESGVQVNVQLPVFSHPANGETPLGTSNGDIHSNVKLIFPLNVKMKHTHPNAILFTKKERKTLNEAVEKGIIFNLRTPMEYRSKLHAYTLSNKKNGEKQECNNHFFDNILVEGKWLNRRDNTSVSRPTEIDFMTINHSLKTIHLYEIYNRNIDNLENKTKAWRIIAHNAAKHGYVVEPIILMTHNRRTDETKRQAKEKVDEIISEAKKCVLQYFPHVEVRKINVPNISVNK